MVRCEMYLLHHQRSIGTCGPQLDFRDMREA
jgi:hypothetical protein